MCLISVLPKGKEKYNEDVIKFITNGFNSNKDGSGIMWKRNGISSVNVRKGFFKLNEILSFIKKLKLGLEDELVVHHRVGTQGRCDAENTHPFVVSNDHKTCISVKGEFKLPIIMHNGVFRGVMRFNKEGYSDTYSFTHALMSRKYIMDMLLEDKDLFEEVFGDYINRSKLCILFPDRDLITVNYFIEDKGYLHSNECYKDSSWRDTGGRSMNSPKVKTCNLNTQNTQNIGTKPKEALNSNQKWIMNVFADIASNQEKSKKLAKIIKLDDTNIKITSENCKNFYYMLKDGCKSVAGIRPDYAYLVTRYDTETSSCCLYQPGIEDRLYQIPIVDLKTIFSYAPVKSWKEIYNDFMVLDQYLKPTKDRIQRLIKQLKNKDTENVTDDMKFIVKDLGIPFCKGSVQLYVDKYKILLDNDFLQENREIMSFRE